MSVVGRAMSINLVGATPSAPQVAASRRLGSPRGGFAQKQYVFEICSIIYILLSVRMQSPPLEHCIKSDNGAKCSLMLMALTSEGWSFIKCCYKNF